MKTGGLESSGQRLISLNAKTKRIEFLFILYGGCFSCLNKLKNKGFFDLLTFLKFLIFSDFWGLLLIFGCRSFVFFKKDLNIFLDF